MLPGRLRAGRRQRQTLGLTPAHSPFLPDQGSTALGRSSLPAGRGGGGQPVCRRGRREDPGAGRQRHRCRGGGGLRAERRRAAVGRHRRRRLHDDPPGAIRSDIGHRQPRDGAGRRHARHVRRRAEPRRCRAWRWACRAWCAARDGARRTTAGCRLAEVLQPAIKLADDGFAATPRFVASPNVPAAARLQPREEFAAGGRVLLPGRQADPGRGLARHQQAAGRDLPQDRRARRRLLLQADAREGLRHRQGHRRGPTSTGRGPRRQGRQHDAGRPGAVPGQAAHAHRGHATAATASSRCRRRRPAR